MPSHLPSSLPFHMNHVSRVTSLDLVSAVHNFMRTAGQKTNKFNADQACLYTGLQLEELAEQLEVIAGGCVTPFDRAIIVSLVTQMQRLGSQFKSGLHTGDIMRCDHAELMDGQFDSAWVALGALMSTAAMPVSAIAHGAYTNLSKFPEGVVLKDANGKIMKPPGWQPPDFDPFVDRSFKE